MNIYWIEVPSLLDDLSLRDIDRLSLSLKGKTLSLLVRYLLDRDDLSAMQISIGWRWSLSQRDRCSLSQEEEETVSGTWIYLLVRDDLSLLDSFLLDRGDSLLYRYLLDRSLSQSNRSTLLLSRGTLSLKHRCIYWKEMISLCERDNYWMDMISLSER